MEFHFLRNDITHPVRHVPVPANYTYTSQPLLFLSSGFKIQSLKTANGVCVCVCVCVWIIYNPKNKERRCHCAEIITNIFL